MNCGEEKKNKKKKRKTGKRKRKKNLTAFVLCRVYGHSNTMKYLGIYTREAIRRLSRRV